MVVLIESGLLYFLFCVSRYSFSRIIGNIYVSATARVRHSRQWGHTQLGAEDAEPGLRPDDLDVRDERYHRASPLRTLAFHKLICSRASTLH